MNTLIDLVDRYIATALDFWILKPRKFIDNFVSCPQKYLSSGKFLYVSLSIEFVLITSYFAIIMSQYDIKTLVTDQELAAKILAVVNIAAYIALTVFNTIIFYWMSKIWPIKGIASFKSILDFQIYTMALYTPFSVFTLIGSALVILISPSSFDFWISFNLLIGFSFSFLLMFLYDFPGLGHLNRVSTGKVILSYFFWSILLGIFSGFVVSLF